MKVMIFAAGLGTRLGPLTDNKPKALVELNGVPLLEHLILKLKNQGFNDFVINVHHFADQIETFLEKNNNFDSKIEISDERNLLLETGGAILKAEKNLEVSSLFMIHNADIITDIDLNELIEQHRMNNALVTLAVQKRDSSRKLFFDEKNYLCQWKNINTNKIKKARIPVGSMTGLSFSGIHIINSNIFKLITERGKFSIIDLYLRLAENHKISAFETNHSYWYDLGKPENISEAEKSLFI